MYRLNIKLKQHSPLIHFQHNQEGATLRATEVKPKLDRFLLIQLGKAHTSDTNKSNDDYYNIGVDDAKEKGWLIGDTNALDYRMRIVPDVDSKVKHLEGESNKDELSIKKYPIFFGNLKTKSPNDEVLKYNFSFYGSLHISFSFWHNEFLNLIKGSLCDFFLKTNFGARQSKGFGSFSVDGSENIKVPTSIMSFNVSSGNCNVVFEHIDLFYKSLRGGINLSGKLYFKSLLFLYARSKGIQWEKRKIKEAFFLKDPKPKPDKRGKMVYHKGLNSQETDWETKIKSNLDEFSLYYKSNEVRLIRDLFGLSTLENWMSYSSTLSKTDKIIYKKGNDHSIKENDVIIQRMQSPLLFKPIKISEDEYKVHILINEDVEKTMHANVLGKTIIIENNWNKKHFPIHFPGKDEFDIKEFFDFILNKENFDIEKHVLDEHKNTKQYDILEKIYSQLMNQ